MQGQLTEEEFFELYWRGQYKTLDFNAGSAVICNGKSSNFYIRHNDGSWTNSHCQTSM